MKSLGRILLAFSAILLVLGAWMHTAAFNRMSTAVSESDIAPIFGKGLKVLWLEDSTIAVIFAIIFAAVAIRPSAANKLVIILLALVPIITAAFVYHFIGNFIGGHVFLAAGVAAILGGLLSSAATDPKRVNPAHASYLEAGLCNFLSFGRLRKL